MKSKVPAVGPEDAKIVIVGDCPSAADEREGAPFQSTAGKILDGMLEEAGITREECYLTNVVKYRAPTNDFSKIPPEDIAGGTAELLEELARVRPNIIVLCGDHAMQAVLDRKGVSSWRGSILESRFGKCIPIHHPASIAKQWSWRPITVVDIKKAKAESGHANLVRRKRESIVMPTYEEALGLLETMSKATMVSFDIEVETQQICSIAIADSASRAISIPFWFGSSGSFYSLEEEYELWLKIRDLLEDSNVKKVAQNAQYDCTILQDKYDINVSPLHLDTMIAFHCLYPELPKNLGNLASLYTDVAYYKYQRKTDDMVEFFRYNASDALVTYEIAEKLEAELREEKLLDFYREHMHSLLVPLMAMTKQGVRIDSALKKEAIKEYRRDLEMLSILLVEQVGHELNPNSPKQMKEWLYEELKLKKQYKGRGKSRSLTADAEALNNLFIDSKNEALHTILTIREKKKILSTYLEVSYDKEGDGTERARTSYLITGTETGRLSSRSTVYNTGTNLQNVPKGIARRIFIPDKGYTFINADLSQAEARVVAYLAEETRLIAVFDAGGDIHTKNAANIFSKAEEDITKEERTLAKRVVHASNYGMGYQTFSKTAGISLPEARRLLNLYFATYPRIKLWQLQIASTLRRTRTLTTPLGRRRTFFSGWADALKKEAYAFIPQSTVADLLNIGLRRVYEEFKGTDTQLLLQIHDAVLAQCPIDRVAETAAKIRELLMVPIRINRRTLVIPVDVEVGPNWNDMKSVAEA